MSAVVERRRAFLRQAMPRAVAPLEAGSSAAAAGDTITEVRAFAMPAVASGSTHVVLQVRTRSGLIGYGECRSLSRAELKNTADAVTGKPAAAYEVLDQLIPRNIRAALNMALLDLLEKATGAPVFRLLGGATRNKVRAVTRLSGVTDAELKTDLDRQLAAGYRAFLMPLPAPTSHRAGSASLNAAVARFQAMRSAAPAADFAIEADAELSPGDAGSLAAALEPFHPLWFNEPCPVSNAATLHKIADETVVPLGFGRDISDPGTFQQLLRDGVIDLLRPDVLVHGISGTRRLAALAETYYVDVAPWNNGGGPVANAAALHVAASISNFFIAQMSNPDSANMPRDGFFALSNAPGLGVSLTAKQLERGVTV